MSLSAQERSEECKKTLCSILASLHDGPIDETLIDPNYGEFATVHPTTWDELLRNGWIERLDAVGKYRFTGTGWLGALRLTGQLLVPDFETKIGKALSALKACVKGRGSAALVPLNQIAQDAGLSEGFVFNIIESKLVEEHHGRTGAKWQDRGRLIFVPRDFNIETTDLNALIREETERRVAGLHKRVQELEIELGRYRCPHCGAALSTSVPVEVSEHHTGCYETFDCGYATMDGQQAKPCLHDPVFPKLDEFELQTRQYGDEWICIARGKTKYARQLDSMSARASTEEDASSLVIAQYNYKAGLISNAEYLEEFLRRLSISPKPAH